MGSGKGTDDPLSWAEQLSQSQLVVGKPPPKGENWKTSKELMEELDITKDRLKDFLQELKKSKKLKYFTGSAPSKTIGVCCRQVWYRLI